MIQFTKRSLKIYKKISSLRYKPSKNLYMKLNNLESKTQEIKKGINQKKSLQKDQKKLNR